LAQDTATPSASSPPLEASSTMSATTLSRDAMLKAGLDSDWQQGLSEAGTSVPPDSPWLRSSSKASSEASTEEPDCPCSADVGDAPTKTSAWGLAFLAEFALAVALLLAWLYLPTPIFSVLAGFAALQVAWATLEPFGMSASWSGCFLLPLYLCGCTVFLACQTPQL